MKKKSDPMGDGGRGDELLRRAWEHAGHYHVPAQRSREEAWERLQSRIAREERGASHPVLLRRIALYAAAGVILFLALGILFRTVTIEVPPAQKRNLTLPRKVEATLNSGSSLRYHPYLFRSRVYLWGEGFFRVPHGTPFKVITEKGTIEVGGTAFHVSVGKQHLEVACYEGKVLVRSGEEKILLHQGEGVRKTGSGTIERYHLPPGSDRPSWDKGSFSYHDVPLQRVIEEMEKQFGVKIHLPADERHYTGYFTTASLEEALQLVCLPMGYEWEIRGNEVFLRKEE